jgi:hypothetical protein
MVMVNTIVPCDVAKVFRPSIVDEPMITRLRLVFPFLALALLTVAGCTKNPNAPAQISGVVKYNGKPLPGGTIKFHDSEGKAYSAPIQQDGKYELTDVPVGEMKVTVETESLNPAKKQETYGGQRAAKMGMSDYNPAGLPARPGAEEKKEQYVKIPGKYNDISSSGLSATLKKGKNSKDFDLTD